MKKLNVKSTSSKLEPLLPIQLMQEATNERQFEGGRQNASRSIGGLIGASNNHSEKHASVNNHNYRQQQISRQNNGRRHSRTSSLSDRRSHHRRLSSFSSTESDSCGESSANATAIATVQALSKHDQLMASLPTITLLRALEPEDEFTAMDLSYRPKQKQKPQEEILYLPPQKPKIITEKNPNRLKNDSLYRTNGGNSSYQELSKYRINSKTSNNECDTRRNSDHVIKKYSQPVYDRKRPTVLNNDRLK